MVRSIEFVNWQKFNPRSDYHSHWFRIEDDIFSDEDFVDFEPENWTVYLYLLTRACQRQGKAWELNLRFITRLTGCDKDAIEATLNILQQKHIVRIRNGAVTNPGDSDPSDASDKRTLRTVHNEHNKREENPFPFSQPIGKFIDEPKGPIDVLKEALPERVLEKFFDITHRMQKIWIEEKYTDHEWLVSSLIDAADFKDAAAEIPSKGWSAYFTAWLARGSKWNPSASGSDKKESFKEFMLRTGEVSEKNNGG